MGILPSLQPPRCKVLLQKGWRSQIPSGTEMGLECTKRIWEPRGPWLKLGNSRHSTCWEIANPMTTSSSRTSQVTTAELAFRCLTVTLTGADGLSAGRESRAFTGAGKDWKRIFLRVCLGCVSWELQVFHVSIPRAELGVVT